ncbi:MAG TPA: SagB family peptide dehydrogenase [Halomicronema sp.]
MSVSSFTLSLREEITLVPQEQNLILQSPVRKLTFHKPQAGLQGALSALKQGNQTLDELQQQIIETDGIESAEQFEAYLERLIHLGWVCHSLIPSSFSLIKAIPMAGNYQFDHYDIDWEETVFTLSRFAYLRQVEGKTVLECPLSQTKIILLDWRSAALIAKLAEPQTVTELIAGIPDISEEIGKQFIYLLLATQMLSFETDEPPLVFWEFHDLLFHSRSRNGRHNYPLGGIFPFKGKIDPLPAVKPLMGDTIIELAKPNLDELKKTDISLTEALEKRSSIREHGETPMTVQQLGELLYRCARVKKVLETDFGEISRRPYPGGGAIYELEIYPVVRNCEGLETGIYQYHPLDHVLCPISEWTPEAEALITDAWYANGQQVKPQVLLVITARFGRLFWKYRSMGYAAILKHVGVMYQTLYLVATSMNLAPSALGAGNSDLFAAATGIDYYEEASVGEFMLGSVCEK